MVASSILTRSHVNFIVRSLLGFLTHDIPFSLLSNNLIDKTLLTLEVIAHLLRLIRCFTVLKDRQSGFHTCTIHNTTGINRTTVHIHGNHFGSQFYLFIVHLTLAIQMHQTIHENNRVIGFIYHWSIQRLLLLPSYRIKRKSIRTK